MTIPGNPEPRTQNPEPRTPPAPFPLTVLTGPTASGKSDVGLILAERTGAEILSVDSMQVYRGMDIGTAKPAAAERARVPHHLLDLADPSERFDVARYLALAHAAIAEIRSRGREVLAAGGTPLYLKALREGIFEGPPADPDLRRELMARAAAEGTARLHEELRAGDPQAGARIHPNDLRRIVRALEVAARSGHPISSLQSQWGKADPRFRLRIVCLSWDRAELYRRIEARVDAMFKAGLVEEVERIAARPGGFGPTASKGVGYRETLEHLRGETDRAQTIDLVKRNTRRLAKRQLTWFRSFPDVAWIPCREPFDPGAAANSIWVQLLSAGT